MFFAKIKLLWICLTVYSSTGTPDNRGKYFIIGFMENFQSNLNCELFITTSKTYSVNVNVTTPKWFTPFINISFDISFGTVKQINITKELRMIGTSMSSKGVLIEATDDVVVYGFNKEPFSSDAFLAIPTDAVGNEYYIVTYYPSMFQTEFLIIGIYNFTLLNIKLGRYLRSQIIFNGKTYTENQWLNLTVHAYDSLQIQTSGELTGSYVVADKPFSLFSGNTITSIGNGTADHLVEQQISVDKWGKVFATVPIPGRIVGDYFRFLSSESNTVIKVEGLENGAVTSKSHYLNEAGDWVQVHFSSNMYALITANKPIHVTQFSLSQVNRNMADPSMIIVPPVELYAANYVFTTPKSASGVYKNYFMFVVKRDDMEGLRINGVSLNTSNVQEFPGGEYVGGSVYLPEGTYDVRHISPICVFGGILYGTGLFETYGFPAGIRLAPINSVCLVSGNNMGDGIDNDCDGKIDEELYNNQDDDGDGVVDEDCASFFTDKPCYATPCLNNGTCIDNLNGNYSCACEAGYDPQTDCKSQIDFCANAPCPVDRMCSSYLNGYDCICKPGFTGANCTEDIDECASTPCIHGSCTDLVNRYICLCDPGYTDLDCKTDINECASSPCVHGNCSDIINGYICVCQNGYSGRDCQTSSDTDGADCNTCQDDGCVVFNINIGCLNVILGIVVSLALIGSCSFCFVFSFKIKKKKRTNVIEQSPFPFNDVFLGESKGVSYNIFISQNKIK